VIVHSYLIALSSFQHASDLSLQGPLTSVLHVLDWGVRYVRGCAYEHHNLSISSSLGEVLWQAPLANLASVRQIEHGIWGDPVAEVEADAAA
jgi:hypothetical protein